MKGFVVLAGGLIALAGCSDDASPSAGNGEPTTGNADPSPSHAQTTSQPEQAETDEPTVKSPGPSSEPQADDVALTVLFSAEYSGIDEPVDLVVRERTRWRDLWSEVTAGQDPLPEVPEVDFARDMVLFVGLGQRPSGGYTVGMEQATHRDGRLQVEVIERTPGEECATTRAITSPVVAVTLPQSEDPVEFVHEHETYSCDPE